MNITSRTRNLAVGEEGGVAVGDVAGGEGVVEAVQVQLGLPGQRGARL